MFQQKLKSKFLGKNMRTDFSCRSCENNNVEPIILLGELPLANALVREPNLGKVEEKYPLELVFCPDCSLLQITETVEPKTLFEEYLYFSSYSESMLKHSEALVDNLIKRRKLSRDSLVIEIASNDGYLLQYFKKKGIPVLGIEPAKNIAKVAREERGVPTLCKFFDVKTAVELKRGNKTADVIIGNNVLAHVADLNGFIQGVNILLKDEGVAVFEFPYVRDMIEKVEFDTIYHEHLCYYSLTSVKNLFARHKLMITDVERIPIHGGSLRIYVQHNFPKTSEESVKLLLAEEKNLGMNELIFYKSFAGKVLTLKGEILKLLKQLKNKGKRIAAYGAAAKGSTLLNYFGIGKEDINYVVDRSLHKQGLYMAGNHIPIYNPGRLLEDQPDYVLLLTWNFADEILQQQDEYRKRGGKFIIPIPEVEIL